MYAEDSMDYYNFYNKGKLNNETIDYVNISKKFVDIMENRLLLDDH